MIDSIITPSVSVLVTVYNRERYLATCLESILASTWHDFEVVVVDDASTDESLAVAHGFESRDRRVRLYGNQKNLGDYPNRMRAAELARGRYLKYVDSDDLIYRHSLAIMVEAMDANPKAALALSHSLPQDEQFYPWMLSPVDAWRKEFLGRGCLGCGPSSAIMRRDAFIEIGGFGNWGVLNDTDLWYRMSARWPVVLLPPGLVWWRRHEQQEFTKNNAATVYLERGFALTMETLSSPDCPLPASDRQAALQRARQHHCRRILSLALCRRQPASAWRLFKLSGLKPGQLLSGFQKYS